VRIVFYAIWGLFMAGVVITAVVQVSKARRRKKALALWPRVQAVVTGYDRHNSRMDSDSRTSYYPRYEYRGTDGQVYRGRSETVGFNTPQPGRTLQVAVNPENPAESVPEGTTGLVVIGCASALLIAIAAGMFFFIQNFPMP